MNQPTHCHYCNKCLEFYLLSLVVYAQCSNCNVNLHYLENDSNPYQITIEYRKMAYTQFEEESLIISYIDNRMVYGYYKDYSWTLYQFPKTFPIDYLLSHSKEEIYKKIKSLLTFS